MKLPGKGWRVWTGAVGVCLLGFALVWPFVPAPLPKTVRLGTGAPGGRYAQFGEALAARLRAKGFAVELVPSAGSADNLAALGRGAVDVAFVQGGVADDAPPDGVVGISSLFYEPIWIFHRRDEPLRLVSDLQGKRIAIGEPGSGSAPLARTILGANGITEGLLPIGGEKALDQLGAGAVDAAVLVQAPNAEWIRDLLGDGRFGVLVFERAAAYAARFRHLEVLEVPRGFVNLASDIPTRDIHLLTTTANLAVRNGIHPRLIPLLIELCRDELARGTLLAPPGRFPSLDQVDLPLSEDAVRYYRTGPSWLYRYLPFDIAYTLDRLSILLIPLLTLLYPLLKGAGPLYRWTVLRRVYPWYRVLEELEDAADLARTPEERSEILRQLRELQESVADISVPARYTGEVFALRRAVALVIGQVKSGPDAAPD